MWKLKLLEEHFSSLKWHRLHEQNPVWASRQSCEGRGTGVEMWKLRLNDPGRGANPSRTERHFPWHEGIATPMLRAECLCPLPIFLCWSPDPQCDGICLRVTSFRWGHGGRGPCDGISVLRRRRRRRRDQSSLSPPLHRARAQQEGGHLQTRRGPSPNARPSRHPGLPNLHNCEESTSAV